MDPLGSAAASTPGVANSFKDPEKRILEYGTIVLPSSGTSKAWTVYDLGVDGAGLVFDVTGNNVPGTITKLFEVNISGKSFSLKVR